MFFFILHQFKADDANNTAYQFIWRSSASDAKGPVVRQPAKPNRYLVHLNMMVACDELGWEWSFCIKGVAFNLVWLVSRWLVNHCLWHFYHWELKWLWFEAVTLVQDVLSTKSFVCNPNSKIPALRLPSLAQQARTNLLCSVIKLYMTSCHTLSLFSSTSICSFSCAFVWCSVHVVSFASEATTSHSMSRWKPPRGNGTSVETGQPI